MKLWFNGSRLFDLASFVPLVYFVNINRQICKYVIFLSSHSNNHGLATNIKNLKINNTSNTQKTRTINTITKNKKKEKRKNKKKNNK